MKIENEMFGLWYFFFINKKNWKISGTGYHENSCSRKWTMEANQAGRNKTLIIFTRKDDPWFNSGYLQW